MFAWQFAELQLTAEKNGWTKFISMQNHYNLVYREEEREMNPYCLKTGVDLHLGRLLRVAFWLAPIKGALLEGVRIVLKDKTEQERRGSTRATMFFR